MGGRNTPEYYSVIPAVRHNQGRSFGRPILVGLIGGGIAIAYSMYNTPGDVLPHAPVPPVSSGQNTSITPTANATTQGSKKRLVVLIDPGHGTPPAGTEDVRDPKTGYKMADYKNTPETKEVYDVSLLVKKMLESSYDVRLTKQHVNEGPSLRKRAEIANVLRPAIMVIIHTDHTQPDTMQWVTPQKVGNYRGIESVADGTHRFTFTNKETACISAAYAEKIVNARTNASGIQAQLHDLNFTNKREDGSVINNIKRAPGNISWIQLLGTEVPAIYNEYGGKNGDDSTIELTQEQKLGYATGIAKGVIAALTDRDAIIQGCQQ